LVHNDKAQPAAVIRLRDLQEKGIETIIFGTEIKLTKGMFFISSVPRSMQNGSQRLKMACFFMMLNWKSHQMKSRFSD
jgi:hypothetical protein